MAVKENDPFQLIISDLSFAADYKKVKITSGEKLIEEILKIQTDIYILVYSVEDKSFVIKGLFDKLDIYITNCGMAQVCSVLFSYLFLRGQGIKLLSFVSKQCAKYGFLINVLDKIDLDEIEKYEGAIVLKPYKDIYFEPIAVADFNSLYPSCMISHNLSHDPYIGFKIINKGLD